MSAIGSNRFSRDFVNASKILTTTFQSPVENNVTAMKIFTSHYMKMGGNSGAGAAIKRTAGQACPAQSSRGFLLLAVQKVRSQL